MARVLLIDDDQKLLSLLERAFRFEGFEVESARNGDEGLAVAHRRLPDLVILDIGIPARNGLEVCRDLRSDGDVPIVMLTARDDVLDKVRAFDLGADDYVTKPFAFDELIARVRALLRRRHTVQETHLAFADLACDLPGREVVRGGRALSLTQREFDLLVCFLRHPRQVLTREALLQHAWPYPFEGGTNVVDVYVGYLRQKLGEPRLIHTVRGVGYVLRS